MMTKKLLIFFNFIPLFIFAQIEIEFSTDFFNRNAIITIENTSSEKYVLPLQLVNLKDYFEDDNICESIEAGSRYLPLSLSLVSLDKEGKYVESNISTPNIDYDKFYEEVKKWRDCYESSIDENIKEWQKKYKLPNEKYAEINHYIYRNLLFLRPHQKIRFSIYLDLSNISQTFYPRISYLSTEGYKYYLQTEIKNCIYDYLTKEQKAEFSDHKMFIGTIKSNLYSCPIIIENY